MAFDEFFRTATNAEPYPWQDRVAAGGLPEAIDVETGAGKTAGVVLAWLFRLLHHRDAVVRSTTPAWLVFALPMRSLVDQTHTAITGWLHNLGLANDVPVYRLLGGEGQVDAKWRERPGRPTVIVGTVDMLLSRALMRGYASSRWLWPVEYGVLHAGTHWVFDEVQLLGPALATGRQLDAFRQEFGTAAPCSSTWMSATLREDRLWTVDNPQVPEALTLDDDDRAQGLAMRLDATRTVVEYHASTPKEIAQLVVGDGAAQTAAHVDGSLTLVIANTVQRAQHTYAEIRKRLRGADGAPEVELLHSRFRPAERDRIVERALVEPPDPGGPGRILVATQVVEAGVDISARTLVTECATWSSIVQRAGRCNRAGEWADGEARLLWSSPPRPEPYEQADLDAAASALRGLEGRPVTASTLRTLGKVIGQSQPITPVLRRRDLLELFDTSPDLVGADVDISRFIRDGDDIDIQIAWREPAADNEMREPFRGGPIRREELCRVQIGEARSWLRKKTVTAWAPRPLDESRVWGRVLDASTIKPGMVIVASTASGGYDPTTGWDRKARGPVPMADEEARDPNDITPTNIAPIDETTVDDPASFSKVWVRLDDHLRDTRTAAMELLAECQLPGLADVHRAAVVRAAAVHDLGKMHEVFQTTMRRSAAQELQSAVERLIPLAKSGSRQSVRHHRAHFRHELVSALLLSEDHPLLGEASAQRDLVRYLVAAHHGRVRLAIRSIPGEAADGTRVALGVIEGEVVGPCTIDGVELAEATLHLDEMAIGEGSWTAKALALRDRDDLGPFRLATLEALVRLADWQASAAPSVMHTLEAGGAAS